MIRREVLIVGGGLAGMAAALALTKSGIDSISVLDRRPMLGGRAYSYSHPVVEEVVDSQHVVLGCCTNLIDLMDEAAATHTIRWYDDLIFLEPHGSRTQLSAGSVPAPAHRMLSFLRAPMLSTRDKLAISHGLLEFIRGYPASDAEAFSTWLKRTRQTERAVRHFWEPVIVGALNDSFENCSTKYAGKIFHESFLRSPQAGRLGVPVVPLSDWLAPLTDQALSSGVDVHTRSGMISLEALDDSRWRVKTEQAVFESSSVILAIDFKQVQRMLATLSGGLEVTSGLNHFIAAPITTIHLWYDRTIMDVDHAVLLDTRIQWIFVKSRIRDWAADRGTYLELVISASWPELKQSRKDILASAIRELEMFFPAVRSARLVKSAVLKEARATFSVTPGLDRFRPAQQTQWPGLYLAGDWTATEWPATMEGAVRSGRLAAGALVGQPRRFLAAELPATGLMRVLAP